MFLGVLLGIFDESRSKINMGNQAVKAVVTKLLKRKMSKLIESKKNLSLKSIVSANERE